MISNSTTVAVDIGPNTTEMLEKLASQLGMTVEQVWPFFVKQAVVSGTVAVSLILVALLVSGLSFAWGVRELTRISSETSKIHDDAARISAAVGGSLFALSVFAAVCGLPIALPKLFNPEFWAIKELVRQAATLVS